VTGFGESKPDQGQTNKQIRGYGTPKLVIINKDEQASGSVGITLRGTVRPLMSN
jgi:hypothetical protein